MEYLTSLPGVGHKTAACVLVFAAQSDRTLPVDTHLFRVTRRLGLTSHDGTLTATTRDAIVSAMLSYGPRPGAGALPVPPPRPHHLHRRPPPLR